MQFGNGAGVRVASHFLGLLASSALLVALFSTGAHATDSSRVQVSVDSGTTHPALEVKKPASPATVNTMPVTLSGNVKSLTQIQVYVDNVFSVTIPLDEGAPEFSYGLVVPQGTHEVKLVGISPFVDNSPTVTLAVAYEPPSVTPDSPGIPATTSSEEQSQGGAVINRDATSAASTTYLQPAYTASLPSWFYNGLVTLDIAKPNDTDGKELVKTVQRIALASSSLFILTFTRPTLAMYKQVRYGWLGLRKHPTTGLLHKHPLASIRVLGVSLLMSVFFLI